ncbi:MAG: hypothetical protein A2149_06015 [Candidatus Schekmanbacteria bacterium RBG_16_38_11]|uniref:Metallo-beta-lactamase domain-containing protein n=1 Tax=Candidatus Schekmanbacteria bacterium RBG_16_38_11 TaxID=1817880 RepID=A0A1F7RWR5_9BACT|nr:MAG: hypothetical protein A2149_06015 [Candidatus Schekmanbacteria bacterium RBG_16_38_11]
MIIQFPGKINEGIKILGTPFLPIYLVMGKEEYALIEGGVRALYPLLREQLSDLLIDTKRISHLVMLHSHVDHTGIANLFKKDIPDLQLCASEETAKAVATEEVSPAIKKMEETIERFLNIKGNLKEIPPTPNRINIDKVLHEDEKISLGEDLTIEFFETPGHSPCSLSAYIPEQKALFVSDSAGLPLSSKLVFPMVFANFDKFVSSCEKLSKIDADIVCFGHFLALTGKDAKGVFLKILDETIRMKELILEKFAGVKDIDAVITAMGKRYNKGYIKQLTQVFFEGSARAIIKIILQQSREEEDTVL